MRSAFAVLIANVAHGPKVRWQISGLIEIRLMLRTNGRSPFLIAASVAGYSRVAFANHPRNAEWGLEKVAESLLWVAAAILAAGLAIGAGVFFRRRD